MTVSELGEHALIARILGRLPRSGAGVVVGPGDDAAVLAVGRNLRLVVTTDALVEDVHFTRSWSRAEDIGHKALAVNLSDLAAMGATPRWALLSLAVPGGMATDEVDALVDGLGRLALAHGISVVGGNITQSPGGLVVNVTAGGEVGSRKWLTRSGGRPGDGLWLSGEIGGARAGLEMCREGLGTADDDPSCVARYQRPDARVRLGIAVARQQAARAAMDLSDGLADAVRQLSQASGCGARINRAALPVAAGARRWWSARNEDAELAAVVGGDDFELLLAVPPRWEGRLRNVRRQVRTPALTKVGVLTREPGIWLEGGSERSPWPEGYEHYRA